MIEKLPKFLENSILLGDKNKGIEITKDNGLYVYENGKKHLIVTSNGYPAARECRCGAEEIASGSFYLYEIEATICQKCGGLIVKLRGE